MNKADDFGKPEGKIGRVVLFKMNCRHGALLRWALNHYDWNEDTDAR